MTEKISNKKIEESLNRSICESTPDILESLMQKLDLKDEPQDALRRAVMEESSEKTEDNTQTANIQNKNTKIRRWIGIAAAAAAALLLATGVFLFFRSRNEEVAVVGIDVNPGVELSVSRQQRILKAIPLDSEGAEILNDLELKGCEIKTGCNAVIEEMLERGYLNDTSNSVLLSVRASEEAEGVEIEQSIIDSLSLYLNGVPTAAAVFGQYVTDSKDLEAFAAAHGISLGKAWLIRSLLEKKTGKMTEDSLIKLTTQELILLGMEKNAGNGMNYGAADESLYIGPDKAVGLALQKAGLSNSQTKELSVEYDSEDGFLVYEVEFVSGGFQYEYSINAVTGQILSEEIEGPTADYLQPGTDQNDGISDDDQDDDRDDVQESDDNDWQDSPETDDDDDNAADNDDQDDDHGDDNRDDDEHDDRDDDEHDNDDRDDDEHDNDDRNDRDDD